MALSTKKQATKAKTAAPVIATQEEEVKPKKRALKAKAEPLIEQPAPAKAKKSTQEVVTSKTTDQSLFALLNSARITKVEDSSEESDEQCVDYAFLFEVTKMFFGQARTLNNHKYSEVLLDLARQQKYYEILYLLRRHTIADTLRYVNKEEIDEYEKLIRAHNNAFC